MSTTELRKQLIERVKTTENLALLEEAYRLLQETDDTGIYKLSDEQRTMVNEGREQINNGKSMTNEQSDQEIDEWLNK